LPYEITELKNLTRLELSGNQLTQLPLEITELKNLTELYLLRSKLTQLPLEIGELKNLTTLNLSENRLTQLPPEFGELKKLTELVLYGNRLIQLPPEIGELKNLTTLYLYNNELTQLPPEIGELKSLTTLDLYDNQLTQLPPEIGKLKNLTKLDLSHNQLTQLPPEIGEFYYLTELRLSNNRLTQLSPKIGELKNFTTLDLSENNLTQLPPEIGELKNLTKLDLSGNQLTQLPPEIGELKNLTKLFISNNQLTQLSTEIIELKNLKILNLFNNPLISPPPEIVSRGVEAIFTYLKQSRTTENNEAKLILVGNGEVGKTCLAHRLINDTFFEDAEITQGINISKWIVPALDSGHSDIKLNIWDFGGQEIYHSTHQFFLTKRSVYLLVWNARKTKDYDHIYYWLHTIEAFGEDSPIILVMSKMNESNDDLNLKDIKSKFPQIVDYAKIDSSDGRGIDSLTETIRRTAWNLPLMRVKWVDSWYKARQELEGLGENWIDYDRFYEICKSESLDNENINVFDDYLNDLGVTLHFRDRIGLKNIVILKPEWATGAFYNILSTKSVLDNEGVLTQSELSQIWDTKTYPHSIYPQLMELMNKFELAYELPDKSSYLVPELLPKSMPNDFEWDEMANLCFFYCYDTFLPPGIIPRLIVRMHHSIAKKENGMPLCWREGIVLEFQKSYALVEMKSNERQIEIKIKGDNKREGLAVIRYHLDSINASIKKIKVSKQIPCNCSDNCYERYFFEDLLKAENNKVKTIQCHKSFKHIQISLLLDGYRRKEEKFGDYNELNDKPVFNIINHLQAYSEANSIAKAENKTDVSTNITVNLQIDLPRIQIDFDNLSKEVKYLNPELDSDLEKIQDSLDELSTSSDKDRVAKPFNKLYRFLDKLSDPNSEYSKVITGTQKGIDLIQKVGRTYNKFAQWLAMPQIPDLLVRKS
jgi:internalin A